MSEKVLNDRTRDVERNYKLQVDGGEIKIGAHVVTEGDMIHVLGCSGVVCKKDGALFVQFDKTRKKERLGSYLGQMCKLLQVRRSDWSWS